MTTTAATSKQPGAFRLPGYTVAVGPFTHVAAERDRLAALEWRHFDARQLGATVGAEITGVDLTAALPDEVVAELRQALHDYKVIFFRDQPLDPASARRVRAPLRRPGGPPVPAVEHRRARAGPLREDGGGQRLRELVAPRRDLARAPVHGGDPARRVGARVRRRHALLRHVRRLRRPRPGDEGRDRRAAGGARLHPDVRAHHVRRGAPEGAGAVPAGAPPGGVHPPRHREAAPLREPPLRQPH